MGDNGTPAENEKLITGKRKSEESPTKEIINGGQEVISYIDKLSELGVILTDLCKEHTNTQRDIKQRIVGITAFIRKLDGKKEEIKDVYERVTSTKQSKKIGRLFLDGKVNNDVIMEGEETSTEESIICAKCKKKIEEEKDRNQKLKEDMMKILQSEDNEEMRKGFEKLTEQAWPEEMYEYVKLKKGVKNSLRGKLAILYEEGDENSPLLNIAKTRYPDLEDLMKEDMSQIQELSTSTKTSKGVSHSELFICRIKKGDEKDSVKEILYSIIQKGNEPTDIALTEKANWGYTRKVGEIICRKKGSALLNLVVPGNYKQEEERKGKEGMKRIQLQMKDASGTSKMSDLMKTLKQEVEMKGRGIKIDKILGEDKSDRVEIRVKEDKQGALTDFIKEVESKVEDKATMKVVESQQSPVNLIIRNIDNYTESDEVLSAIREMVPGTCVVMLSSLRQNFRKDGKVAKVSVSKEAVDKLLEHKLIKIGWTNCPIDLMIEPVQCYKCWKHGHRSHECKTNSNMSNKCRKCLGTNHVAKDCHDTPKCADCGGEHQTGVMACEKFRTLVNWGREKAMNKKGDWETVQGRKKNWSQVGK